MSKPLFVFTPVCMSGKRCEVCRKKIDGKDWRAMMNKIYSTPGDAIDFNCPKGLAWDDGTTPAPPPTVTPPTVATTTTTPTPTQTAPTPAAEPRGCSKCEKAKQIRAMIEAKKKAMNTII